MPGARKPEFISSSDDELKSTNQIVRERRQSETHHETPMKRKHKSSSGVEQRSGSPPKKIKHESQDTLLGNSQEETLVTANDNATDATNKTESPSFITRRSSFYVPLSPICNEQPLEGICAEHLSPLILIYHPPFKGVVLAYEGAKLSNQPDEGSLQSDEPVLARALDEYAASYIWVTANFLLFCPQPGHEIEGWITLQNESHLGLVCWNYFTASISRDRLPSNWSWVSHHGQKKRISKRNRENAAHEDTGYFTDEHGAKIEGLLKFRVAKVDLTSNLYREQSALSVRGTLLSAEAEESFLASRRNHNHRRK